MEHVHKAVTAKVRAGSYLSSDVIREPARELRLKARRNPVPSPTPQKGYSSTENGMGVVGEPAVDVRSTHGSEHARQVSRAEAIAPLGSSV